MAAAIEEMDYPISRETAVLMDMWDLSYAKAGTKKRERYPRPFKSKGGTTQKWGDVAGRSRDEVIAILHTHGRLN